MQIFIQLQNKTKLFFYSLNNGKLSRTYTIHINQKNLTDFFIDQDNIIYSYGENILYKVVDGLIPLYYDAKYISFEENILMIANNFVTKKITDTNFQTLNRAQDNTQGVCMFKNDILMWSKSHFYYQDKVIDAKTEILMVKTMKDQLFFINYDNILFRIGDNNIEEIISLTNANIKYFCFNEFLPVVALLGNENVFIVDIDHKKTVKVIDSHNVETIKFKNKREIFLMGETQVIEYHLGKDIANVLINTEKSRFFFFELEHELKIDNDNFKEEVRSKLIENKIENKRMIFKLMNEIESLKAKMIENDKRN